MRCCICNNEIEGTPYQPYPFNESKDYKSKCCEECYNKYVLVARHQLVSNIYLPSNSIYKLKPNETVIDIFWSVNSNLPLETYKENFIALSGTIETIDRFSKKVMGTWGNFQVDLEKDAWFINKDF